MRLNLVAAIATVAMMVACSDASPPIQDQTQSEVEPQTASTTHGEARSGKARAESLSVAAYDFTIDGPDPIDMEPVADIRTATDFAEAYPERAEALINAFDLDLPQLSHVTEADSLAGKMEALAAYYRRTQNGAWLKGRTGVHDPGGFDDYARQAGDVLNDVYEFQSEQGRIARLPNGRIDWYDRSEKNDLQWEIFLNRNFQLLPLLKQYADTKEADLARYIDLSVKDWVTSNSPPAEATVDKQMPGAWRPMSSASRLLQVWPQAFYALQDEPAFTDAGRLMMLSSVPEQADHILRYHRVRHNHAVKEMIGLSHAAAAWPEFRDSDHWKTYALDVLNAELDFQIYPDGVQKELAVHYHRTVMEYMLQYVEFMRATGKPAPDAFERRIEDMGNFLALVMRPNGTIPLNNNSDLDNVRALVGHLADVFDRRDWRYIATNGERGTEPAGLPSRFWPYAGQLVSRSGWSMGDEWSIFEVGPWGISHQHNDKLHLSIHAGRDLIVDTGRYIYQRGNPLQDYVRGARGHNVVFVDGQGQRPREDQLERSTPMTDGFGLTDQGSWAVGTYNEGFDVEGEAIHHRAVAHLPGTGWVIADWIETDRPRQLETQWHFHPDVRVERAGLDLVSRDEGQTNVRLTPLLDDETRLKIVTGEMNPVRGWYSPSYNVILPASLATYETHNTSQTLNIYIITTAEGVPSEPDTELLFRDETAGTASVRLAERTVTFDLPGRVVAID